METREPVKIKKRRRSNFILDLTMTVSLAEDDYIHIQGADNGTIADRQISVHQSEEIMLQDDNAKKLCNESCAVNAFSDKTGLGDQKEEFNVRLTEDSILMKQDTLSKESIGNNGDSLVTALFSACETGNSGITADSSEHADIKTVNTELNEIQSQQVTESDTCEKKEEAHIAQNNAEGTPPDDIQLTTPQSMSPDYPVSPSDIAYLGNHDDSYISYLQPNKISDRPVNEVKSDNNNETSETQVVTQVAEESNTLDASRNSLEVSLSDREDTVLSLSDKENTVIENKSDDQIDEGRPSESPGFLSLCKTFAGKVVDMVKTSPSYLSNILQANNNESPPINDALAKTALSPEVSNNKSFSEIKLALEKELNKSIEKSVQSPKQVVQVYSVTEITKSNQKCENDEKAGKESVENDDNNADKEAVVKVTKPMKTVASKAKTKRRKSSSKMFFDTFNAVSNELNKVSNSKSESTCDKQADEIDGFSDSCMSCIPTTDGTESKISQEVAAPALQDEEINIEIKNSDNFVHAETNKMVVNVSSDVDIQNNDNDCSKKLPGEKTNRSSNTLKKPRKRRSTDIQLLHGDHHSKEKHKKDENSNNSASKRKQLSTKDKSVSQASFTEIKEVEQAQEAESERPETFGSGSQGEISDSGSRAKTDSELSSLDMNNIADITDSTSSVLEGISKLDLELTLPLPGESGKHFDKNKRDRRRRRSNNFYFSSIYNETEEQQMDKTECPSTGADKTNAEVQDSISLEAQVLDCSIHTVTEEISQVEITDRSKTAKSVKECVHRLPDIEELAELEPNNEETEVTQNKSSIVNDRGTKITDKEVNNSQSLNVTAETVEDIAPRRRRRRSADAAILKIQMHALESDMSPVAEQAAASPGPSSQKGRKRKKAVEIPIEDIYRNKNYVKPPEKTWETIFESPKTDQLFSKRKAHTCFNFEDNTFYNPAQDKVKKRQKRAIKNGWDPKKRKRKAISEDAFQVKIGSIFAELDEEVNSISDKIKDTIRY